MPPTPIPVGYGIVSIKYTRNDDGDLNVVTWGVRNTAAATALAGATLAASSWIAHFTAASTCDSYTFEGAGCLIETATGQQSADYSLVTVGTLNAEPPPPVIAARVTKQTLFSGRKHRGRVYLCPGLLSAANIEEGGVLTGAQQASLQTAVSAFMGDMNSGGWPLVLLHKDLSTPDPLLAVDVRASVGTQRRRQHLS